MSTTAVEQYAAELTARQDLESARAARWDRLDPDSQETIRRQVDARHPALAPLSWRFKVGFWITEMERRFGPTAVEPSIS